MLDQGIDSDVLQIFVAIAEFEHALMSARTREGLAAGLASVAPTGLRVW